jgi:SNF2 domain-containing protein/helicase-like protein
VTDEIAGAQTRLEFDGPGARWPPADRFPHNFGSETVGQRVRADLTESREPLLVTGYTSLEWIIDYLAELADDGLSKSSVRILIGFEPRVTGTRLSPGKRFRSLPQEIADHWLTRGISVRQAPDLLRALKLLDSPWVRVRQAGRERVHAKIYVGDEAVTIGSSNFSHNGMVRQIEGNVRFTRADVDRYPEAVQMAESIWALGEDYKPRLMDLLQQLLSVVTWPEAVGRAVGEILEGDWAKQLISGLRAYERPVLWRSQDAGIVEALWILEHSGSVLVADATGSGKTRLGAGLIRALVDRNWRMGRARRDLPVMICPPPAEIPWGEESNRWGQDLKVYSHGKLSSRRARKFGEVTDAVSRSQILAVDEAHNFLNLGSQRSRGLLGTLADHVVLFTATPINRSADDLVSVINLLGADNFDEAVLKVVGQMARRRRTTGAALSPEEIDLVRGALSEFVVRRTKSELNRLVARNPHAYRDVFDRKCRYPAHKPHFYKTGETEADQRIACEIQELGHDLRGLVNLKSSIRLPDFLRQQGYSEEAVLRQRLGSAPALARWQINSTLRSSRAALWEHVFGTPSAVDRFELNERFKSTETGDVISKLREVAGNPPEVLLRDVAVPPWLSDPGAHEEACEREAEIYRKIGDLCDHVSKRRLEERARFLFKLWQRKGKVLGFDRALISLFVLKRSLLERGLEEDQLVVATGDTASKDRLVSRFQLGAEEGRIIGLCSDAVSEAINLQEASTLVHLDLPTVVRTVEQRVGRIDRMDSPHEKIDVYWPKNSEAFSLRSDERLVERMGLVEALIGSNVPLPDDATGGLEAAPRTLQTEAHVKALEAEAESAHWDGLTDAFGAVRGLVEGEAALLPNALYEQVARSEARVISAISVVKSHEPWVFLAVAGLEAGAPRWALVQADAVSVDLQLIPRELRLRLDGAADQTFDERASELLAASLDALRKHERTLLPRRKARALTEMEAVLEAYRKTAKRSRNGSRQRLVEDLLRVLKPARAEEAVDLGRIADWWLDLIRPMWKTYLTSPGKKRVARIRSIRKQLQTEEIPSDQLKTGFEHVVSVPSLDRRVIAAVIGVG